MNNKVVIDVETKKTFSEVGGLQSNHHLLGISFVGVYSYSENKYFGFLEKDLAILEKILLSTKPQIIGFNTKAFDNKVLQPYFKKLLIADLPQLDILEEITNELGFRLKLESVAKGTIGEGKSGTGLDAIRYFREKDFDSLAKYCLVDVRVTKEVYEFGRQHGCLYYFGGGEKRAIPIKWGDAPTLAEVIAQAFQQHRRLQIRYYELDEKEKREVIDSKIDILTMDNNKIKIFCHTKDKQKELKLPQILTAKISDETYAHQAALI